MLMSTNTTHLLSCVLLQALLAVLVVDLALLCIAEGFIGVVDFSEVLGCLILLLLRASHLVCTSQGQQQQGSSGGHEENMASSCEALSVQMWWWHSRAGRLS